MNHKLLELKPSDLYPSAQKKRPDKIRYYHFNIPDQAFYDADIVIFREDGKPPQIMKNRYGEEIG